MADTIGAVGGRTASQGYGSVEQVRQGYTGYENDEESKLDYAQARYYNSAHGRFTSVDPLTASANVKDPQTFNRYSYVLNSPYKFSDPLGLLPLTSAGACGQFCRNSGGQVDGSAFSGWYELPHTGLQDQMQADHDADVARLQERQQQNNTATVLKIRIQDPNKLLNEKQLNALKDEVTSIYKDIKITVNFVEEKADYRLIIAKDGDNTTQSEDAFGSTPVIKQTKEVLNFGYVYVNRVKELATVTAISDSKVEMEFNRNSDENLGTALGRAASHEIGHYLLQLSKHGDEKGVMSRGFSGLDWFASSTRYKWYFTKKQKTAIMNKLAK